MAVNVLIYIGMDYFVDFRMNGSYLDLFIVFTLLFASLAAVANPWEMLAAVLTITRKAGDIVDNQFG